MTKKKTLPHFPFYPADFAAKTMRLTDAEVGAYIRLLNEQWITGDIPLVLTHDGTHVTNVLRMICESADTSWPAIAKYFEPVGSGMKNPRMEEVRLKAEEIYSKRVLAGKASAESRATSVSTHDPTSVDITQNSKLKDHNVKPIAQKERKRFAPPSLDEVIELFTKKDSNKIEAEKFYYFYESKNWMVGKNKMKSWRASVGGWIARNKSTPNQPAQTKVKEYNINDAIKEAEAEI
jgi:uncharacterized protein YdaU (DUF1376 family)